MGEVFRGTVREAGTPVAVKILRAELMADRVIRVIDLVIEGETLGIVMELVRGRDCGGLSPRSRRTCRSRRPGSSASYWRA
jgi:hypothetical protein